jgi:hypothetical protein
MGLKFKIENPIIILKDRPFLENKIVIDLGKMSITNKTLQKDKRWALHPESSIFVNIMDIQIDKMKIDFTDSDETYEITPSFDMEINYERLNESPMLID